MLVRVFGALFAETLDCETRNVAGPLYSRELWFAVYFITRPVRHSARNFPAHINARNVLIKFALLLVAIPLPRRRRLEDCNWRIDFRGTSRR